jgi:dephospho-CoA kinase
MTKIIGLTGGIGSGKTTVARQFESFGIPIYIADEEAKKIMELPDVIENIKTVFGDEIFDNAKLNRQKLAKIVFNDKEKLQELNKIVHPKVKSHFENWLIENKSAPIVIKETALLFETGSEMNFDSIITVTAPLSIRVQRVIERDKIDNEAVLNRINNQISDEIKIAKSNFVIHNDSLESLTKQVKNIYNQLLN